MDDNSGTTSGVNSPEWPEETRRRHILVVTLIAVGVSCLAVILHEYAHALAHLMAGADSSTIRAMSADPTGSLSTTAQGWTAAAGPSFSLVAGLIVWGVARRLRGAAFQMAFWFYIAAIQNAAGYLVITPFGVGDTATMVERWGWPTWVQMVMPVIGAAMMFGLAAMVAVDVRARFQSVRGLRMAVMWPVLWATSILVAVSLVLAVLGGYDADVVFVMVMSMVSVYVAALMCSIFWGRCTFRGLDRDPGPLWLAVVVAALGVALWVFHGLVGVTIG
ncbi:hypothetical protein [Tessaracoccus antarcticus]|nr:hypothetical protein [Tessaracoccus antarcticus]